MIRLLVTVLVLCLTPSHSFFDTFMYPCSSALVCVDITKCNGVGVISKNDVVLSKMQELFRMPLVPCRKSDGEQGVCCRDPDYKDDWPTDVKYYDQKGQYTPKPTTSKIIGAESKPVSQIIKTGSQFDAEELTTPATKAPVSYLPPTLKPQVKQEAECAPGKVRLPNGDCGDNVTKPVPTYLPPTKNVPTTVKITTTKSPPTPRTTLPYNPDRTYLPPPRPATQLKSLDLDLNNISPISKSPEPQGHCVKGKMIELNNKKYCCEPLF